jgi:hypothetical protein
MVGVIFYLCNKYHKQGLAEGVVLLSKFLESLSKQELLKCIDILSKNLLTLDGYWFLGVEDRYGQDVAIEIDRKAWERYAVSEARRVKSFLNITEGTLDDMEKAVQLVSIAPVFAYEVVRRQKSVVLTVRNCRPQTARIRSGRGEFPCKPVGLAHLSAFAREINQKFKARCIHCPPDKHTKDAWCSWEFYLE